MGKWKDKAYVKKYNRDYHARNREKARAYSQRHRDRDNARRRERYSTDPAYKHRVNLQNSVSYRKHSIARLASSRPPDRTKNRQSCMAWRERNQDKHRAARMVKTALLYGRLERKPCACCGAPARMSIAHHEDYSKPLEVIWLCRVCHKSLHQGRRFLVRYPTLIAVKEVT